MKHPLRLLAAALLVACPTLCRAQARTDAPAERPGLTARELGYDIAETGLTGRTFVVSPGGDDANPGTADKPMRTPQAAADRVEPGDTVLLRAGEYRNSGPGPVLEIRRGGDRRNWVRFASYPGETAVIRFDGLRGIRVADAAYVVIEGFEVVGVAGEIDPAEALAFGLAFDGTDFREHRYFGVGVRLGDNPDEHPHHVIVRGNRIHHTPGGGVATCRSDYVLIEGNEVFKTSFYSPWGESGVSLWRSVDSDGDRRSYKMVVKDNLIHQNDNKVPFWMMKTYSDGNGVILDANDASPGAGGEGHRSYRGRFLVVNNACWGNGGRGVNVFETSNADVLHNTLYRNATRGDIGSEVELGRTDRIRLFNNLLVVGPGNKAVGGYQTEREEIGFNLLSGSDASDFRLGDGNLRGDPGFEAVPAEAPSPDGEPAPLGDAGFRLTAGSPAVDAGTPRHGFPVDLLGRGRDAPDVGAFERQEPGG